MTRRCRTVSGAAFSVFVAALLALATTACGSAFGDALSGERGFDAVVTPTPEARASGPTGGEQPGASSNGADAGAPGLEGDPPVVVTIDPADDGQNGQPSATVDEQPDSAGGADDPSGVDDGGNDSERRTMTAAWIYDGDTFRARTESGASVDVRLIGINAPEADECFGQESTDMLIELIAREQVELVVIAADEYGRLLADVTFNGEDVNLAMVRQGGALALHSERGERLAALSAAEENARQQGLGMWGSQGCAVDSGVSIETVNYDAEGRDDYNPNGEWVVVTNAGPPQDLSGWGLRDESTRHRFAFPNGLVLDTGDRVVVHSGCADDDPAVGAPTSSHGPLYWCDSWGPIWTNRGDSAYLTNASGQTVDVFAWP